MTRGVENLLVGLFMDLNIYLGMGQIFSARIGAIKKNTSCFCGCIFFTYQPICPFRRESRRQGASWELAKDHRHVACLGLLAFCSASAPTKNWQHPMGKYLTLPVSNFKHVFTKWDSFRYGLEVRKDGGIQEPGEETCA